MEKQFLKIKKKEGELFLKLLEKHFKNTPIIDQKSKTIQENDFILFPLIKDEELIINLNESIKDLIDYELITKENIINPNYKYKSLQEALEDKIPQSFYEFIPNSYDIIGNIGIIEFDKFKEFQDRGIKAEIAKALMSVNKNVKGVFEKTSNIKGTYRLRELTHLYGESTTITEHKENSCIFKLDIRNSFFSPRLVFERNRVAKSDIKESEIIIDLFAGVGPFSIQITKLRNVIIHAFDINPNAFNYLKENINLNKLIGEVNPHNSDVKELFKPNHDLGIKLKNSVDRIIMNLPERSIEFIDIVCFLMKETGGILHYYDFSEKPKPIEKALKKLRKELRKHNWLIEEILETKIVKAFSPKSDLVVLDIKIKSNGN